MLRAMRTLPLLLGLAACGNSSYYPQYGDSDDTGAYVFVRYKWDGSGFYPDPSPGMRRP